MVQYQHPISFLGLPPLVLICIAFLAVMAGVLIGIFVGVAPAFVSVVILALLMFVGYRRFAKGDRHAEKVYLSGLFYWMSKHSHYCAGRGR